MISPHTQQTDALIGFLTSKYTISTDSLLTPLVFCSSFNTDPLHKDQLFYAQELILAASPNATK